MSETTNMQVVPEMAAAEEGKIIHNFKEYTLRNLQAKDVFSMSRIIRAIGIEEFKRVFSAEFLNSITTDLKDNGKDVASAVGIEMFFEIAGIVMNGIPKCEKDVYAFISNLSGIPVVDVETLPMNTFFNIIMDIVKKDEFKDFIGVVSKLFK